jgi:hypothetical protein
VRPLGPALGAAFLAIASCAHNAAPPAEAANAHVGEALPRFCVGDECGVVMRHNAETESCECAARMQDEALGARVDLVFAVPASGGKAEAWVGRAVSAPETLQRCLLARAAGWSFPSPSGGPTRFRTGIIFAPDEKGPCPARANAPLRQARVDKEKTRLALAARRGEVRACFEEALGRSPELAARTVVTLMLNRDGLVIQAQVDESTFPDDKIERCIVDKAYGWQLPKPSPPGVVTVTYPYSFAPGE